MRRGAWWRTRIYLNKQDYVYFSIHEDKKFAVTYEECHTYDELEEDSQTFPETQEERRRDEPMPIFTKSNREERESSYIESIITSSPKGIDKYLKGISIIHSIGYQTGEGLGKEGK